MKIAVMTNEGPQMAQPLEYLDSLKAAALATVTEGIVADVTSGKEVFGRARTLWQEAGRNPIIDALLPLFEGAEITNEWVAVSMPGTHGDNWLWPASIAAQFEGRHTGPKGQIDVEVHEGHCLVMTGHGWGCSERTPFMKDPVCYPSSQRYNQNWRAWVVPAGARLTSPDRYTWEWDGQGWELVSMG